MPVWRDVWGVEVRASEERLEHARMHRELHGYDDLLPLTLAEPDYVFQSQRDPALRIYDRRFELLHIGIKDLWVVVKWHPNDAFLLTAHFTDRRRKGRQLWP
jgi:hypothetical protein